MMYRVFCCIAVILFLLLPPLDVNAAKALPGVSGRSAALIDLKTGTILGGYNQNVRIFPASTTKILTAMLVLEQTAMDEVVTISHNAQNQEGTSLYTREGETYKLEDLMYAMLVQSCNDAAVALAEHVAGTVEAFAAQMNQRAAELGATNSRFVNPNGLHDDNHYSTAADMALIFAAAMRDQTLRQITTTRIHRVTIGSGEERLLVNGNDLLLDYQGTIGGKTGYTTQAGQSLLTAAARGEMELGAVVFKAQGKAVWTDAKKLLDFGFENWKTVSVVTPGQSVTAVPVRYGQPALLVADQGATLTAPVTGDETAISQRVQLEKPLQAPLSAGTVVGVATYYRGEQVVAEVPLRVATSVARVWYSYWQVPLTLFMGYVGFSFRQRMGSSTEAQDGKQMKTRRG